MWVRVLTFCGVIPFAAAAVAAMTKQPIPLLAIEPIEIARSYGTVIACFMAGAQWGYCQRQPALGEETTTLLLFTNGVALAAWFFALVVASNFALFALAILFALLWAVDLQLARRGWISSNYLRLRTQVTALVIIALLATAYAA